MKNQAKKILMAMSGGVDSSVATAILKKQGHNVVGVFLKFWQENNSLCKISENKCCSEKSFLDAKKVCQKIGIPFYVLNYEKEFKQEVVDYFLNSYKSGNTPNPCIVCNKKIKLGLLIKYVQNLGFDALSTGHYARIKLTTNNELKLLTARDKNKDQSYFLYTLDQDELRYLIFPLGNYTKNQVRKLAKKWQLPIAEKRESQEVCFVGDSTKNFLKRNLDLEKGFIKTIDGKIIGEHGGLPLYTFGQRQGINIGGKGPYYVIKKDFKDNKLIVSNNKNDPGLFSKTALMTNVNWISDIEPDLPLKCFARHRYGAKLEPVTITEQKRPKKEYLANFKDPVRNIRRRQSIVFD